MTAVLHSFEACQGKAEQKAEFIQLRAKGLPYVRIAERLGVATSTLANWNAELEAEIASARAMELEALQAEFFVLKEGRITILGEQLQRLRGELASRGLTEVPTERLLELLLRILEHLQLGRRAPRAPPRPHGDVGAMIARTLVVLLALAHPVARRRAPGRPCPRTDGDTVRVAGSSVHLKEWQRLIRIILALFPRTVDKAPDPATEPRTIRSSDLCVDGITGMIAAKLLILLGLALSPPAFAPWGALCPVQRSNRSLDWHRPSLVSGDQRHRLLIACIGWSLPSRSPTRAGHLGQRN